MSSGTSASATRFVEVRNAESLEEWFARSQGGSIVLFKHSRTCPISSAAYDEMTRCGGEVALVVVQTARDVSREIERRTGVRHESPQAIALREGRAVWSASHYDVTAAAVREAAGAPA